MVAAMCFLAAVGLSSAHCRAARRDHVRPAKEARAREPVARAALHGLPEQSIDDSDAPLARDLRLLVRGADRGRRQQLPGDRFPGARYGEFVLAEAAFRTADIAALAGAATGAGGWWASALDAFQTPAEGGRGGGPRPLTADEEARLRQLMAQDTPSDI